MEEKLEIPSVIERFSISMKYLESKILPCIIVPIYRLPLTLDEEQSLCFLEKHLGNYPRVIVAPRSLGRWNLLKYGSQVSLWDDSRFSSVESYSQLLMSEDFYEEYSTWSHLLIYQLDCLIFRDELIQWCASPWDYLGAPWFHNFNLEKVEKGLWAVGNGGLSLRRTAAFLKVLRTAAHEGIYQNPYLFPHYGLLPDERNQPDAQRGLYHKMLTAFEKVSLTNPLWNVSQEIQRYMYNEDAFWSFEAMKFDPDFQIPPVEEALKFAFEMNPSWCFVKNEKQLPFGCHAWGRYDRSFWEQIIANESV